MNLQENINRIKQVMGVLNEQASGGLVTDDVYAAIGNIEKVFSKVDENDNIIGIPYDSRGKEENIKQAIKSTIGFDNWNKMDSKLKGQVYSFMFQYWVLCFMMIFEICCKVFLFFLIFNFIEY